MSEQLELEKPSKKERPKFATAHDVIEALRAKYPANAYAFLTEVADATGFARRHCDALVMSLWPSRGLEIIGFEVKVRRSDWLKELAMPEKAEAIAQYCDRWYLAVGDEEIVKEGELPASWGLFVPMKDGLRCRKEAKLAEPAPEPGRSFLAALMRSIAAQLTPDAKLQEEFMRGRREGRKDAKAENWHERDLLALQKQVATFERKSGVKIKDGWNDAEAIGNAVYQVMHGVVPHIQHQLEQIHATALRIATSVEDELAKQKLG
jgi:hypothetical protein